MRGRFRRHGLPRRLALLVLVGLAAPTGFVAFAALRALDALGSEILADRQGMATSFAARFDAAIEEDLATLGRVASEPRFDPEDADPAPEVTALHRAWLVRRRHDGALLLDAAGRALAWEPADAPIPDADSPALRAALAGSRPLATSAIPTSRGPRALLVSPLSDWRGRSGVFAAFTLQLDEGPWLGLLRPVKPRPGLTASLLDAQGRSLAALQPPAGPVAARPDDVVAEAPLRATPWQVVVRQPRDVALEALVAARRQFAWLVPIALALALAFGLGAARSITQPLAALDEAAGRIARGDLEAPVPDLGEDEVGRLGRSLDEMRGALRRSLAEVVQARDQLEERVRERTAELRELYRQLKEHDEARGRLLQKVISAQEEERRRMARELHDETCQTLTALVLAIDAAAARADAGAPSPRADVKALATRALDGVHALIFDLRPSVLDDLGLLPAVRWLGARHLESHGVSVRCEFVELPERLPPELETALFRVVQEALVNVARHAQAETVLIQIAPREGQLEIEIEDDGRGFAPEESAVPDSSGRGLGLLGMRERIELLGGRLQVDSSPGNGTRVLARVPLPPGEASV